MRAPRNGVRPCFAIIARCCPSPLPPPCVAMGSPSDSVASYDIPDRLPDAIDFSKSAKVTYALSNFTGDGRTRPITRARVPRRGAGDARLARQRAEGKTDRALLQAAGGEEAPDEAKRRVTD